jgi:hypothetical protein
LACLQHNRPMRRLEPRASFLQRSWNRSRSVTLVRISGLASKIDRRRRRRFGTALLRLLKLLPVQK